MLAVTESSGSGWYGAWRAAPDTGDEQPASTTTPTAATIAATRLCITDPLVSSPRCQRDPR